MHPVATTGDYNSLINKPNIDSGDGFSKVNARYEITKYSRSSYHEGRHEFTGNGYASISASGGWDYGYVYLTTLNGFPIIHITNEKDSDSGGYLKYAEHWCTFTTKTQAQGFNPLCTFPVKRGDVLKFQASHSWNHTVYITTFFNS